MALPFLRLCPFHSFGLPPHSAPVPDRSCSSSRIRGDALDRFAEVPFRKRPFQTRGLIMTTRGLVLAAAVALWGVPAHAQGLGGAGTVQGIVKDPTGAAMAAVTVDLSNPVTGFKRSTTTDTDGKFVFRNLPPNHYHVEVTAQGFAAFTADVDVRNAVPIDVPVAMKLVVASEAVQVVGHAEDLVERDPTAHTDVDQSLI